MAIVLLFCVSVSYFRGMRNIILLLAVFCFVACGKSNKKQVSLTVSGNCDMCKSTIETASKSLDGVYTANWDNKSHQLVVEFDSLKVTDSQIHVAIANKGYDTDLKKASDKDYDALETCCQYR